MAAFLELLARAFDVVRIKPKLFDPADETRNNILVNMELGGMICEVQLMLYEHAQIKRTMHKFYEITRSSSFVHCLHPLWLAVDESLLAIAPEALSEMDEDPQHTARPSLGYYFISM